MSIDERLTHNLDNGVICIDGENYSIIKREINESSKQIIYHLIFENKRYNLHVSVKFPRPVIGLKFSQQIMHLDSVWLIDLQKREGYAPERIEVLEKIS